MVTPSDDEVRYRIENQPDLAIASSVGTQPSSWKTTISVVIRRRVTSIQSSDLDPKKGALLALGDASFALACGNRYVSSVLFGGRMAISSAYTLGPGAAPLSISSIELPGTPEGEAYFRELVKEAETKLAAIHVTGITADYSPSLESYGMKTGFGGGVDDLVEYSSTYRKTPTEVAQPIAFRAVVQTPSRYSRRVGDVHLLQLDLIVARSP